MLACARRRVGVADYGVWSRMAWATREIVYVYCGLQGREESADFQNFDARHLPDDVVNMMDVDKPARGTFAQLPNPFDSDEEDDEDDEDFTDEDDEDEDVPDHSNVMMQVDSVEPAPEFVEGSSSSSPCTAASAACEDPNSPLPSPPTQPASAIPPRFRKLSHPLPRLFSFRTEPFEPGYMTPEGTPYVGRGTPVDKARRRDWASIPVPPPRYSPADESWFASLVTTSSILSGSPAADASFGVPTEVGPFCCTQDGLYGAAGSALPPEYAGPSANTGVGVGVGVGVSANMFDYPSPQAAWMDASTFPQDLGAGLAAPPMANSLPHATTGCVFHSCLMDCLTSGLGCVVPPFAGMQVQMPQLPPPPPQALVPCNVEAANPPGVDVGPYDVSMEPVAVQASSALSHALG